jgi:hypothetical protein
VRGMRKNENEDESVSTAGGDMIKTQRLIIMKNAKSPRFPSFENNKSGGELPDGPDVPGKEIPAMPILSTDASVAFVATFQSPSANSVDFVKTIPGKEIPAKPILSPVASVEFIETLKSPAILGQENPTVEIVELPPWKRSNKPVDLEAPPIFMTEMDQGGAQRSGPTDFFPETYRGSGIRQFSYPV